MAVEGQLQDPIESIQFIMTSTALTPSWSRYHELISNSLHRNHVTHVTLIVLLFSEPYIPSPSQMQTQL
ncbi:Nicotinate-nucleotide pyrophosphorylase [Fusarium oxysporum f. sp. albedinis]|nr:Nicotinate-nucleotide pyrophosphorylase [Fusarium oxysporum f. sp. albedinis]